VAGTVVRLADRPAKGGLDARLIVKALTALMLAAALLWWLVGHARAS
jgi:hypothetical protein